MRDLPSSANAYAEDRDLSIGVNGVGFGRNRRFQSPNSIPFVKRNSPTMLNVGFNGINQAGEYNPANAPMFWDMRVRSLETQALEPIKSFEEMRGDAYPEDKALETVVARLNAIPEYRALFSKAFGDENAVNATNLGKAIASFGRSLVANNSPFDRYMRGDRSAMTAAQIEGMQRFERVGCIECHNGPMFSDYKVHVLGVPDNRELRRTSDIRAPENRLRVPDRVAAQSALHRALHAQRRVRDALSTCSSSMTTSMAGADAIVTSTSAAKSWIRSYRQLRGVDDDDEI